jgi:hypothetical protein
MKGNLMKIVPVALVALLLLVPIGSMAASNPVMYGTQSNNDRTTLSGSTVTWDNYIYDHGAQAVLNGQFEWYNRFHNANGGSTVYSPTLSVQDTKFPSHQQTLNLPNLGPQSYTSNFLWEPSIQAQSTTNDPLLVTQSYSPLNGLYGLTNDQWYST